MKTVRLKSYEGNNEIVQKWMLPIYLFSVLITFALTFLCRFAPGHHPTVFELIMLRIIAPLLFAVFPFGILLVFTSKIPDFIPWEVKTNATGQKTEQKKIGLVIYERPYLTHEQRQREIERHDREMRESRYHEKDPVLLKEKEEEAVEFYRHVSKGLIALLLPLIAIPMLGQGEKIPWPEFIKIGISILALFGGGVLLYSLIQIIRLLRNKNETYGSASRRIAYASYFENICASLALLALPVFIQYTEADPGMAVPRAQILENLKDSWFQIVALVIIFTNVCFRMNKERNQQDFGKENKNE